MKPFDGWDARGIRWIKWRWRGREIFMLNLRVKVITEKSSAICLFIEW
jgi:hypothetical protein